ncbi:MAG: AAA family ATPase [Acidimicrobiaceae bacterium]|nr:AAA family ATPase [Acidimicrobiaceae bacterium]MYG54795.1 AAA family ATPase [Acidimicrobiaceae bacterium]MYJ99193.1 AAA family ATPase [Acidimicrobiaceae bacterium]
MRLKSFRVKKFRNVVDSGEIAVEDQATCLVGKNEAGKSALLEALYLFNPAYEDTFNVDEQYPRWLAVEDRREGELNDASPIAVTLELEDHEWSEAIETLGTDVLGSRKLSVSKRYGGELSWTLEFSEGHAVKNLLAEFPASVATAVKDQDTLDSLKEALESLTSDENDTEPSDEDVAAANTILENLKLHNAGVRERLIGILKPHLPKFFRFTEYSTLPGRIDLSKLVSGREEGPGRNDLQTARALLELAGTQLDQLKNDDYELRRGELEAIQIDLTNQVFEYWKQNTELKVVIDIDKETVREPNGQTAVARFLDIRLEDKRTGYSNNFSQRSSGFQWFFSFLAAFSQFDCQDAPVVLLDEPALTLHGRAQADFLRFINERLAPVSPVLYTTHSPFMVEAGHLERVRIVEDPGPPDGATATEEVLATDPDSLFPLQAALGYDIAQSLFVGPNNLVVEGTSDFIYLTIMSQLCAASDRTQLDDCWRILPAGGAGNIATFVSLVGPHLDVTVLADSDTKGMQKVKGMINQNLLKDRRLIYVSEATTSQIADIEDLYTEGDYLKLFNQTFDTSLKVKDLPRGDRIVKRLEQQQGKYIHGKVAETLLRSHPDMSFTDTTLDRFATLNDKLNSTMGT